MAEYIEREKALKAINEFYHDPKVDIAIRNIPTADVVKVVRCKDCEYYDGFDCFRLDLQLPDPDNFCSWAERRSK